MTTTAGDRDEPSEASITLELPNDLSAAGQARHAVRRALAAWHLPTLADNAALAVSELVTNAVKHGLPPVGLRLSRRSSQLRMDVSDARPDAIPSARRPVDTEESGRGLAIISAVSDHTGSERIRGDGKRVFASWDLGPDDVVAVAPPETRPQLRGSTLL